MKNNSSRSSGIGMTSLRTRERLIDRLRSAGIQDETILDVIKLTPRHKFVDQALSHRAYEDTALPIGHNQTLSQPYIVARMTDILLAKGPLHKVLEVGTGSGYQTSVLAQLVDQVYSVERIAPLLNRARQRLQLLGLKNVKLKHADGGMGWSEYGPYDGILVTAAADKIPDELIEQLKPEGRMVIPVCVEQQQQLQLVTKQKNNINIETIEAVNFVPLLTGAVR